MSISPPCILESNAEIAYYPIMPLLRYRRYGTFTGGIDLPDEEADTLDKPIRPWPRPDRLRVPLSPCIGPPASVEVAPGRQVEAGRKIATGPNGGVDVFAPLAGKVTGLCTASVAGSFDMRPGPAVELAVSSAVEGPGRAEPSADWRDLDDEALTDRIAESHIVVHRRDGMPLLRWVRRARARHCGMLVANVMSQQPLVTADHRLLAEFGREVIAGLAMLGRTIGIQNMLVVVDHRRTDAYRGLVAPARAHGVTRIALAHKYPTGADAMLTKVLARRAVPLGKTPMDVGLAIIDAATCFALYRWAACGQRLTGRIVTVTSGQTEQAGNYFVPFGTPCLDLAGGDGSGRAGITHGGPMTGLRCGDDAVVTAATDAIARITPSKGAAPGPCIRCGWCRDHCPARLNVASLNDDFELGLVDHARRSGVLACVSCGVCSYVCPARLPLTQRVNELKWMITNRQGSRPPGPVGGGRP